MDLKPLRTAIIAAAVVISLAIVAVGAIAAKTAYKVRSLGNTIAVTGSAERTVRSDVAKWTSRVSDSSTIDGLNAASARIRASVARAVGLIKDAGVPEAAITVRPLTVYPQYGDPTGKFAGGSQVIGYSLDQTITVESNDVDLVTSIAQSVPARLLDEGVVHSTDGLEYYVSNLADLKLAMLEEGTKNAKDRAERIVRSTGAALGPLQSAGVGVFQVTAVNSTEISDYGAYDTSTIEKKVTAVVRTSFLVR